MLRRWHPIVLCQPTGATAVTEIAGGSGGSAPRASTLGDLRARLPGLMLRDRRRLDRRADRVPSLRVAAARRDAVAELAAEVAAAEQRIKARRAAVPVINYPSELPFSQ